jgi:predicted amidohydrolase YtcJ
MLRNRSATTGLAALLPVLSGPWAHAGGAADLIFHDGVVVTMDEGRPEAQALAVQGGTILAVGTDTEVLPLQGPETVLVDLDGRALLPGFVDPHTHVFNDAELYMGMGLEEVQELVLQNGITALGDLYVDSDFLRTMEAFDAEGRLRIRTTLYLVYTDPCGGIIGDWYRDHPPTADPWAMLRIGGVKMFTDGGVCGLAAVSFEYPEIGGHGDLWFTQEGLNQAVGAAHDAGYQVVLHAIGDRAVEQAQNAIEAALAGGPNTLRHRIDHNSFVRVDLLPRYGEIGVVASIFGYYPTCAEVNDSLLSGFFGEEPVRWLEDWRAFLDATPGFPVAWHGDDPWVGPISPLSEMYSLVTRKEIDGDGVTICEPPDWLVDHAITAAEALPLMNIGGAYALFREEVLGSLTPGKYADLVVLSDNPLTVDPDAIRKIEVLMTLVGGEVEYCRPGEPALCGAFVENLALGRPVTASGALPSNPPEMAVDGDLEEYWSAGAHPPQWVEIDLQAAYTVENIKLVVEQSPSGDTHHLIRGKGAEPGGEYVDLHEFARFTRAGDVLSYTPPEPWRGIRYVRVETVESPSWVSWREIEVVRKATGPVSVGEPGGGTGAPRSFRLAQNYPNPFNPSTTIAYEVPGGTGAETPVASGGTGPSGGGTRVHLGIYDVRGRWVRTLVDGDRSPGRHEIHWDGRDERGREVGSGVYMLRLEAGEVISMRKMILAR